MEKTAIEYLIEQFESYDSYQIKLFHNEINTAKEMEKQQIIDFYCHTNPDDVLLKEFAEQHYNKTFKQD